MKVKQHVLPSVTQIFIPIHDLLDVSISEVSSKIFTISWEGELTTIRRRVSTNPNGTQRTVFSQVIPSKVLPFQSDINVSFMNCNSVFPKAYINQETDKESMYVYNTDNGTISEMEYNGNSPSVFSPDGSKAYTANNKTMHVISAKSDKIIKDFPLTDKTSYSFPLSFTPDGSKAFVASENNSILVIDAINDKQIGTIPDVAIPQSTAVSSDGKYLYVTQIGEIAVIDIAANKKIKENIGGGLYGNIACSPNRPFAVALTAENMGIIEFINTNTNTIYNRVKLYGDIGNTLITAAIDSYGFVYITTEKGLIILSEV